MCPDSAEIGKPSTIRMSHWPRNNIKTRTPDSSLGVLLRVISGGSINGCGQGPSISTSRPIHSGRLRSLDLYGDGAMTSLVRGDTLTNQRLRTELAQYDAVVTFCGTGFDLPMLRAQFSRLPLDQPHIDLHNLTRRVGLRGGLKAIEARIGIQRRADLLGMNGSDAVRFWNRWRHGRDAQALERLIAYNEADCVNLEPLADWLYCRLAQRYHALFSECFADATSH